MLGALFTLLLLTAIIVRCVYVGLKTKNYMNRLICIGIAAMLVFQVAIECRHVRRLLPGHRSDAALYQLRWQLPGHDVPGHGRRLRDPHAASARFREPLYLPTLRMTFPLTFLQGSGFPGPFAV